MSKIMSNIKFPLFLDQSSKMERDYLDAMVQETDGWPGIRLLLSEWLLYATNREARSMLRIHRSPQLRRFLSEFMLSDDSVSNLAISTSIFSIAFCKTPKKKLFSIKEFLNIFSILQYDWQAIERNTALDRAILYIPWVNESFQIIYQLARRFLFPTGNLSARLIQRDQIQLMIRNEMHFSWRITAVINL